MRTIESTEDLPTEAELALELGVLRGSVATVNGAVTRAWSDHEATDPVAFERTAGIAIRTAERAGDPYAKARVKAWREARARARWASDMRAAMRPPRGIRTAWPRASAQRSTRARRRAHRAAPRARGPDPEPPAEPAPAPASCPERGRT